MGAATRVEEAIGAAERVDFDLVPLLTSAVAAYRGAFPERQFALETPAAPVTVHGAPDLIVQMLDKLIDNGVDFSPPGATITVRLRPGRRTRRSSRSTTPAPRCRCTSRDACSSHCGSRAPGRTTGRTSAWACTSCA